MSNNSGVIYEYTRPDGSIQKGIARHTEQVPNFTDHGKVCLRLVNDDLTFKKDKESKNILALKDAVLLTKIGYAD